MHRRTVVNVAVIAAVGVSLGAPAFAGAKKPITKTVSYTDATADPTGNVSVDKKGLEDESLHCSAGKLPSNEKGITFAAPAPGSLKVAISGFQGDWSLQIRDAKGKVLAGDDVNPPDFEMVTAKIKTKGNYVIFPCNMGGTPLASVKYTFTFK
jgi:hypothetical protein